MKKVLIIIKYCLYVLITLPERNRYLAGLNKGMHCYKSESGKGFLGDSTDYYYDPRRKPEREYLTCKEYFKLNEKP